MQTYHRKSTWIPALAIAIFCMFYGRIASLTAAGAQDAFDKKVIGPLMQTVIVKPGGYVDLQYSTMGSDRAFGPGIATNDRTFYIAVPTTEADENAPAMQGVTIEETRTTKLTYDIMNKQNLRYATIRVACTKDAPEGVGYYRIKARLFKAGDNICQTRIKVIVSTQLAADK